MSPAPKQDKLVLNKRGMRISFIALIKGSTRLHSILPLFRLSFLSLSSLSFFFCLSSHITLSRHPLHLHFLIPPAFFLILHSSRASSSDLFFILFPLSSSPSPPRGFSLVWVSPRVHVGVHVRPQPPPLLRPGLSTAWNPFDVFDVSRLPTLRRGDEKDG